MSGSTKNANLDHRTFAAANTDWSSDEARTLFPVQSLQHLDRDSAVRCQALLGHGCRFGFWDTPPSLTGGRRWDPGKESVDLRKRLAAFLPDDIQPSQALDSLLDEGVLWITRYALLLRLEPTNTRHPLDVTSILGHVYQLLPPILASGIRRRLEKPSQVNQGLVKHLTQDDIRSLNAKSRIRPEFNRMRRLMDRGLWNDGPAELDIKQTTSPKGDAAPPPPQQNSTPFPPIPDDYLAEMGPRVLWLVLDLGPNLLHLFEAIPDLFSGLVPKKHIHLDRGVRLRRYFEQTTWHDRYGQPLNSPPFDFRIGSGRWNTDPYVWPPRGWEQAKVLASSLQAAHLWIALLAMAGRISEIATLSRDCIEWARDGQPYASGKTFKLSANLAGVEREWPAPEVFVQALAQQSRLVSAWEHIARTNNGDDAHDTLATGGDHLWSSIGLSGSADPEVALSNFGVALQKLAERIGLTRKPGGKNLHPHRFRKTIARLAGIAIVDSPRVLMRLLGHKDIEMTLHYILTDKALQVEIDQVARELRIMRCQDVLEDIHTALHTPEVPKYGGHGGGGAPALSEMVRKHEEELHREGKTWGTETAYELALILTGNGQYFRVTRPGVLCLKESREAGLCTCDSTCINRIEDKTARRDVQEIIPILIADGKRALEENQLLLVADKLQQLEEELMRFEDIEAEFHDHPDLLALREAVA